MLLALLLTLAAEPPIPADVTLHRAVDYANITHGKLAMDILRPKAPGKYPAVVLIHGGGFNAGNRESEWPTAIRLAQNGFVAATVSYRLAPMFQFPLPLHDVKAAVRFLRANAAKYEIDAARIAATGTSAGATWAQMLAVTRGMPQFEGNGPHKDQSSAVDCAISFYGRSDMRRAYEGSRNAPTVLPMLLGGDRQQALDAHLRASPLNWITPDAAPILAIHGTRDQNVPFEQSVWLVERLRSAGVQAELETIAEAPHGFKGADQERALTRALDFLNRHLKPKLLETRRLLVTDHGPGGEILAIAWPSGRVLWRRPNGRSTDNAVLPNGHVLSIEDPKGRVVELDTQQQPVWSYRSTGASLVSVERLTNGHTLLVDDQAARIFEVTPAGEVAWQVTLPDYKGQALRRARRTAQGTTVVAVQKAGLILEVDAKGAVLRKHEFPNRMPAYAQPLPDGGMLVGLAGPGEVRYLDSSGQTVKTFAGPTAATRMAWTSGFTRTPEGGLLVSDYMGARIVEFDAAGNLVHQLRNITWAVTSIGLLP